MQNTAGNDADQAGDEYARLNAGDDQTDQTDQKHVNASSIIEEDPNINSNAVAKTNDNDNNDNDNDDDDDNDNDNDNDE